FDLLQREAVGGPVRLELVLADRLCCRARRGRRRKQSCGRSGEEPGDAAGAWVRRGSFSGEMHRFSFPLETSLRRRRAATSATARTRSRTHCPGHTAFETRIEPHCARARRKPPSLRILPSTAG